MMVEQQMDCPSSDHVNFTSAIDHCNSSFAEVTSTKLVFLQSRSSWRVCEFLQKKKKKYLTMGVFIFNWKILLQKLFGNQISKNKKSEPFLQICHQTKTFCRNSYCKPFFRNY